MNAVCSHAMRSVLLLAVSLLGLALAFLGAGCSTTDSTIIGEDVYAMRWCPEPVELAMGQPWRTVHGGRASEWISESQVYVTPQMFNEILTTWHLDVPAEAGTRVDLRVGRTASGLWSPWLYLGRSGDHADLGHRSQSWSGGRIDVDYFVSDRHFDRLQVRVSTLSPQWGESGAAFARVFIQPLDTRAADRHMPRSSARISKPDIPRLGVPFRSQRTSDQTLSGRLCSPTSLAMVLAYYGVECSVEQVATLAYDPDFDLYGNWPNNLQAAYRMGIGGVLRRFACWNDVEHTLLRRRPIIASIKVGRGQMPEAPYLSTDGHLIVIEGMTPTGDLLVLDPAVETEEEGRRVYSRANMSRVWLGNTYGTAYVLDLELGRMP